MDTLKDLVLRKYSKVQVFADKVGLSVGAVSNVLNGKRTLAWYHWDAWGQLLGIEPSEYKVYFRGNEQSRLKWFMDAISEDISMYHMDCDLAEDDSTCLQCCENIFSSIEKIIEKRYREVMG